VNALVCRNDAKHINTYTVWANCGTLSVKRGGTNNNQRAVKL
jgi:hypothetical protein